MHQSLKLSALLSMGILYINPCCAQWTAQDSLKLKKILESQEEINFNEEAVKSINFNSYPFLGQPGIHEKQLQFDMTLPDISGAIEREESKLELTLKPYHGGTKFNYDPVHKRKILMDQKKGGFLPMNNMPSTGMGAIHDTRFMMMGGSVSGSFKYDLDRLLTKEFWDFKGRQTTRKTLLALEAYTASEKINGHYEYYHINDQEYSVEFAGSVIAKEEIQNELKRHHQMQKGLLYFKYTDFAKGNFIYFRPDKPDIKGAFTTNGANYRLFCDSSEFVIAISRVGGRYYKIKQNLTPKYQSQYSSQEVEKVFLVSTAFRISFGNDRRYP